jgi:hypothetical protein
LQIPGAGPVRPPPFAAKKAAMGAVDPTKEGTMTTEHDDTGFEPPHTSSPTDHVLAELQLYGYRPFQDEPDPRLLPEAQAISGAVADIFDALVVALADTRLEPPVVSTTRKFCSPAATPGSAEPWPWRMRVKAPISSCPI